MSQESKIPPQNLAAEMSVLGCQLIDRGLPPDAAGRLEEILSIEDFYSDVHQEIQRAIIAVKGKSKGVDVVIVADELSSRGTLADIGGATYLIEVLDKVPHAAHVLHYAGIVASYSRRRKAIEIGRLMIERAYDISKSDQEMIEDALDSATEMARLMKVDDHRPKPISELARSHIAELAMGCDPRIEWGIQQITSVVYIALGSLIVIGARNRHGKSLLALQWLDEASSVGIAGLMISLEMSEENLSSRIISYVSPIVMEHRKANIDTINREIDEHFRHRAPVLVAEYCGTISRVETMIQRAVEAHGVKLVAVDYAQLVRGGDGQNRADQIGDISTRLKQLARELKIVIILLSQLNRKVEERETMLPKSSDLEGSGRLEADADIVLLPYKPSLFDEDYVPKDEYRILVGKDRSGGSEGTTIEMRADFARQRIVPVPDLERYYGNNDPSDRFDR